MALLKELTHIGLTVPNGYGSIDKLSPITKGVNAEGEKILNIQAMFCVYTDNTKKHKLYEEGFVCEVPYNNGVIDIADVYKKLNEDPKYTDWTSDED